MRHLPAGAPLPDPTMLDAAFWRHCNSRRLMFQGCARCGLLRHPPMPFCSTCQSTDTEWREAPAAARVYSYTVTHHATDDSVRGGTPYVVGVVEFEGFGPVRLITNIVADPSELRIGLPVTLRWDEAGPGTFLPLFGPARRDA